MEKVAILGSAFPAIQLSSLLQSNHFDVRVIDTLHHPVPSSVAYSRIDEWSISALSPHLKGIESVVVIIPFEVPLDNLPYDKSATGNEEIIRRVEHILDAILLSNVRRLIYLGDAYSCLPLDDNYGVSEQKHQDIPSSFLLGSYGEALSRAEFAARLRVKEDSSLSSIFLRPVMCMNNPWFDRLVAKAARGDLPFIKGNRRAQHQFIALHNLLQIVLQTLLGMHLSPLRYSGQIVYCVDQLKVVPLRDVLLERSPSFSLCETSFFTAFLSHLKAHVFFSLGASRSPLLPFHSFRLLFDKTVGFSNRKQRLLLDFVPSSEPLYTKKRAPPMRMG
ncbi:hypothetical protein PMAYCL1PPCAC_06749 [Pristionchus mayeri]|uniref:Uncharacterized protein n=1 Tax=Pristionchus mayeri TaxID=1317129 RepID=A0AAN4ZBG3_9BILA|nr:hypothetical protein PMAYCL1PPCAC_06749 [Pristionchus mayeri]